MEKKKSEIKESFLHLQTTILSFLNQWIVDDLRFVIVNRYHVPRSFLKADDNSLIVLEELGGNPFSVNFQTVTVGTVCVTGYLGDVLELSCPRDRPILNIDFATFGNPTGTCGSYQKGPNDTDILPLIKEVS